MGRPNHQYPLQRPCGSVFRYSPSLVYHRLQSWNEYPFLSIQATQFRAPSSRLRTRAIGGILFRASVLLRILVVLVMATD